MAFTDIETGEFESLTYYPKVEINDFDMETGEPDVGKIIKSTRKSKFSIPKEYIKSNDQPKSKCGIDPIDNYTLFKKEEVINLQEDIILGCNKTSHRLFLIPSLFIFTRLSAPLLAIIEVCLHVWAHRKNSKNTNASIYYRSPLHIITAQFCAVCRNQAEMEQVSKLQDKRQKSWRLNFQDVARTIS